MPRKPSFRHIILHLFISSWIASSLLLMPSITLAEKTSIESIPLEELLQPVVAASRYEQRQQEAPSAVSVVTAEEIQLYGYRTLSEVLRSLRGIYAADDRSYTYLGVRGLNTPGDYNTRVLLLLDGLRLNNNIYDTAYMGQDFPVDISLVKRVELIRGPSSSIYGSNAFLGVINVLTLGGKDLRGARATAGVGSLGTVEGSVAYGNVFANGLEVLLSGSFSDSDGNDILYYKEFDAPASSHGFVRDLDGERVSRVLGKVSFAGATLRAAYATRQKDVPTASFGTIFAAPQLYYIDSLGFIDLQYQRQFGHDIALLAHASYNTYWFEGSYPYDYSSPEELLPLTLNRDLARGSGGSAYFQLSKTFLEHNRLLVGAELKDDFHQEQSNFDVSPRFSYLDRVDNLRTVGSYLQAELLFFKLITLNAGLRYDYYFGSFGGSLSPRVALLARLAQKTYLKALAGSAFRAPNAYERFYVFGEPGSGVAQLLNPDLSAEKIQTYELLLEQHVGHVVRLQLGGYYYHLRDLIRLTANEAGDVLFENIDQSHALGLELEVEARWRGISGRSSYSLQRSWSAQTAADLANSPRHLFKLNLLLPLLPDQLFLGLEAQGMSRRLTPRGEQIDPHWLGNATLVYRELLEGVTLSTTIKNIFDRRYSDPGSNDHLQDAIPQNGRTFWVTISYRRLAMGPPP